MRFIVIIWTVVIAACSPSSGETYTLYRNSPLDSTLRIHIATFDSKENGATYNQEECMHAADLYQSQHGVVAKYWCEKGAYKK